MFEQNDLLFSDSPSGDLTTSNIVSNGAAKTVSLRAARNETVAFQLVIERTGDEKLSDIQVLIGDLTGPGGARSWTIWGLDFNSLRAWQYPRTFDDDAGGVQDGEGMLVYRGETMDLDEPVASMRLKLLRRGSQDYEYFRLLSERTQGGAALAAAIVNSVIHEPMGKQGWGAPTMWSHNSEEWEHARYRAGDAIDSAKIPAAEVR